jgi:hypothetical protein
MVHLYHEGLHPTPTIWPLPTGLVEPTDAHACRGDSAGVKLNFENFHVRDYHALWYAFPHISVNLLGPLCLIPRPQ